MSNQIIGTFPKHNPYPKKKILAWPGIPRDILSPKGKARLNTSADENIRRWLDEDFKIDGHNSSGPVQEPAASNGSSAVGSNRFRARFCSKEVERRTFWLGFATTVITLIIYSVQLQSSYAAIALQKEALRVQIMGEKDGSQATFFDFRQDCRDMTNGGKDAGPDCEKYLSLPLKAPEDADSWVIFPESTNQTKRSMDLGTTPAAGTPSKFEIYFFWIVLAGAACLLIYSRNRLSWVWLLWFILSLTPLGFLVVRFVDVEPVGLASWSTTADFLAACELQKENNITLSADCVKYIGAEIKPMPRSSVTQTLVLIAPGVFSTISLVICLITIWRTRASFSMSILLVCNWLNERARILYDIIGRSPEVLRHSYRSMSLQPGRIFPGRGTSFFQFSPGLPDYQEIEVERLELIIGDDSVSSSNM